VSGDLSFVAVFGAVPGGTLRHTCGVAVSAVAFCWGTNQLGQLGIGSYASTGTPTPVSGLGAVAAIALGGVHTCALTSIAGRRTNAILPYWAAPASSKRWLDSSL
jgi:hypothetical protein